jgi:hypothetical protein
MVRQAWLRAYWDGGRSVKLLACAWNRRVTLLLKYWRRGLRVKEKRVGARGVSLTDTTPHVEGGGEAGVDNELG